MGKKLTPKQEKFCIEYMKDLNGKQAAVRAGYSEATAASIAAENLTKPNVSEKIAELKKEVKKRCEVDSDDITSFFLSMMHNTNSKDSDRIKAAENLGKRTGWYEEHNKQKAIPKQRPRITFGESD